MSKYTKKPVTIDAMQWDGDNVKEILTFCKDCYVIEQDKLKINTLEGVMNATKGDYIIKGVKGEFYPYKHDIFELTYEKA